VNHTVEVHYTGGDWADLVADMRSWLDRRQIETGQFEHSVLGRGVAVRVGFSEDDHATAFATAFSGRLESPAPHRKVVPALEPTGDRPAVKAGVSLMITRLQKANLRALGYTDEQIRDMKPEEAHRVLGLINERAPS